jgi:hypothetical protein
VEVATEAHRSALDALQELHAQNILGDGLGFRRGEARRHIESATLRKSTNGRWDKVEDRLAIVWAGKRQ